LVLSTHLSHQVRAAQAINVHLLFQYKLAHPVLQENSDDRAEPPWAPFAASYF
jgi:hypothetical protein